MRIDFKVAVTLSAAFILSGCGAGADFDNMPSSEPVMACKQSDECMAMRNSGQETRYCREEYFGDVFMSSWDDGKTWLKGNCDSTNKG